MIDSGIGGLSVLKKTVKFFDDLTVYYASDYKNSPYGNKTVSELQTCLNNLINRFDREIGLNKISAVVLACNTLSTNCLNYLSNLIMKPIIGTVPPKPNKDKNTLILCTERTAQSEMIKAYQELDYVDVFPLKNLATDIENNAFSLNKVNLENHLPKFDKQYDFVCLGCTHYSLIKKQFLSFFSNSQIVDGCNQVLAQIMGAMTTNKHILTTQQIHFIFNDKIRNFAVLSQL